MPNGKTWLELSSCLPYPAFRCGSLKHYLGKEKQSSRMAAMEVIKLALMTFCKSLRYMNYI